MVQKSRDAFRTISEVADWLDVPTHVLRFWESRFSQIKPVKRAGGRRYYRPSDMRVIGGVKTLLHDQGMTIRGVQKLFREEGIKHVSSFSAALPGEAPDTSVETPDAPVIEAKAAPADPAPAARASRDAEPDPTPDLTPDTGDLSDAAPKDAPVETPVFAHSRRVATKPAPSAASKAEPETPAQVDVEASQAPRPTIPATPDVPDRDPSDDDADHARSAGVAARLLAASPEALAAHRADLVAAAERLKSILERAE